MPLRPYVRPVAFFIMLLGITLAFIGMIQPFMMAIFWSALLAMVFQRPFRILRWKLKGRDNLAATISTILIILIVVIPTFFLMLALVNESIGVYQRIESGDWDLSKAVDFVEAWIPQLEDLLAQIGMTTQQLRANLSSFAVTAAQTAADRVFNYTQDVISFSIQFFLMLYILFFFLRDGKQILRRVINVLPLGNEWERQLISRFASVSRATLKGTIIVAVIQGSIGGITFALLGIDGALFWGVLMTVLSLLPVGGSGLVWGPTAIVLLTQGLWIKAVILIIVGVLGIGLIDNLLRPILVGRDTKMPDYLVLLSTLGGLAWFGLSGFVIGPVIAALFLTFWETTGREYGGREE